MQIHPRLNWKSVLIVLTFLLFLAACSPAAGDGELAVDSDPLTVTLSEIQGTVQVLKPEDGFFADAHQGQVLEVGDQLLTHADGMARLDFSSGTIVRVSPLTTFVVNSLENSNDFPTAELNLEVGEVFVILHGGTLAVNTQEGSATVQGSYMSVKGRLNKLGTFIICLEGNCRAENRVEIVDLIAGQVADIGGESLPIRPGRMSPKQVERWLEINPEAAEILAAVTATVQAHYANQTAAVPPQAANPTRKPSDGPTCGPPDGWTIYVVLEGDTVESIAQAHGISESALRMAACLAADEAVNPGQAIFAPSVATMTPTALNTSAPPTKTAVPPTKTPAPPMKTPVPPTKTPAPIATYTPSVVPTNTPIPTATYTPSPTSTFTPSPTPTDTATPTPTYTPSPTVDPSTIFPGASGPLSGGITVCSQTYSVEVSDIDGIQFVKVQFEVNAAVSGSSPIMLLNQNGTTWSGTFAIDTATTPTTDTVNWRFWARDGLGNDAYYPAQGSFAYTDSLNCTGIK